MVVRKVELNMGSFPGWSPIHTTIFVALGWNSMVSFVATVSNANNCASSGVLPPPDACNLKDKTQVLKNSQKRTYDLIAVMAADFLDCKERVLLKTMGSRLSLYSPTPTWTSSARR